MMPRSTSRPPIRKKTKLFSGLLLIALIGLMVSLYAQSRSELERQRRQKEREINQTRKKLEAKREEREETLEYLDDLNTEIHQHQEYIGTLQNQLHLITGRIEQQSDVTAALGRDMDTLKRQYGQLMYFMYKRRGTYNTLSYIFASQSFNEAVQRAKFIQFYTDFRKKQLNLIKSTEESLTARLVDLKANLKEKELLAGKITVEKSTLETTKQEQSELADKLQGEERRLKRQLAEKQRAAERLDKAIRDAIAREVAAASKKADKAKNKKQRDAIVKDETRLSNNFAGNRSRLPWPVERGFISEQFGMHEIEGMSHVVVNSNGIKFRCKAGSEAHAIFEGEVAKVIQIPNAGIAVLIQHGGYYTVYSNLESAYVSIGDHVNTREAIGLIAKGITTKDGELGLQIWKGNNKLDPAQWLLKR